MSEDVEHSEDAQDDERGPGEENADRLPSDPVEASAQNQNAENEERDGSAPVNQPVQAENTKSDEGNAAEDVAVVVRHPLVRAEHPVERVCTTQDADEDSKTGQSCSLGRICFQISGHRLDIEKKLTLLL